MQESNRESEDMAVHRKRVSDEQYKVAIDDEEIPLKTSSNDNDNNNNNNNKLLKRIRVMVTLQPIRFSFLLLLVVALIVVIKQKESTVDDNTVAKTSSSTFSSLATPQMKNKSITPPDFDKWDKCNASYLPPPLRTEWTTKPLWMPSYPDSLSSGNTDRELITAITGWGHLPKSYYASSKLVKRCKGRTETAVCLSVFPTVDMKPGPETRLDSFYNKYIMVTRNPWTVLPAYQNGKAIKYHGQKGQLPIDSWRNHRDTWFPNMLEDWKKTISVWTNLKGLQPGVYLPFEHLMDFQKGPAVVKNLAHLLKEAGFPVAPDEDLPCLWYKGVGRERLEHYYNKKYEFDDYIPGYTAPQKQAMLAFLKNMTDEFSADSGLVAVLQDYYNSIRDGMPIDTPWTNKTASE